MPFIINTAADRAEMLTAAGAESFNDLITDIPEEIRLKKALELAPALDRVSVVAPESYLF